jgi:hypothetical protein
MSVGRQEVRRPTTLNATDYPAAADIPFLIIFTLNGGESLSDTQSGVEVNTSWTGILRR